MENTETFQGLKDYGLLTSNSFIRFYSFMRVVYITGSLKLGRYLTAV